MERDAAPTTRSAVDLSVSLGTRRDPRDTAAGKGLPEDGRLPPIVGSRRSSWAHGSEG